MWLDEAPGLFSIVFRQLINDFRQSVVGVPSEQAFIPTWSIGLDPVLSPPWLGLQGGSFTSVPTVTTQGDRRSNGFVSFLCRGGYHNGLTRGRSPVQPWPKTFFQTGSRYRDWHSRLRHNWGAWETRCTSPQKHLNYNKLAIIIAFIGTKPRQR